MSAITVYFKITLSNQLTVLSCQAVGLSAAAPALDTKDELCPSQCRDVRVCLKLGTKLMNYPSASQQEENTTPLNTTAMKKAGLDPNTHICG